MERIWYNSFVKFNRTVLSNGLRVLTLPMPSFESATVMVLVGAGSRYETKKNNGISHFLEHMAFKGTEKRPTAMDIASVIDGIGGQFNASTGKEVTNYYVKSSADKIDVSMDVLSDMLLHSKFDPKEIEKEKGVIIEEMNMNEDNPMRIIGDLYENLAYGDTPLGRDIIGKKEIIKNTTRKDFVNYMGSLYSAENIVLVVAGGIDTVKTLKLTEKYFSQLPKFNTISYDKSQVVQTKPQIILKTKKTEQVHLALGFRTVRFSSPDRYPLSVLAAVLGGGMSSRLFNEVREKRGLAYYVNASSDLYTDAGSFVAWAGVDPKKIKDAISVILEEHKKISNLKNRISNKELKKVKSYMKGHWVLSFENSMAVANHYGSWEVLEKKIQTLEEAMRKIDAVTIEEVERMAKKYFINKGLNLAIIGNFASGQEFESLLKL